MDKENLTLRRLLWLNHGCSAALYGDDGEMQCNFCMIDFKRDSYNEIERGLTWPPFGRRKKQPQEM